MSLRAFGHALVNYADANPILPVPLPSHMDVNSARQEFLFYLFYVVCKFALLWPPNAQVQPLKPYLPEFRATELKERDCAELWQYISRLGVLTQV